MRHQSRRVRVDEAIRIDRDRYKGGFRRPFLRPWWCAEKSSFDFNTLLLSAGALTHSAPFRDGSRFLAASRQRVRPWPPLKHASSVSDRQPQNHIRNTQAGAIY
jgi:hypothetical protein